MGKISPRVYRWKNLANTVLPLQICVIACSFELTTHWCVLNHSISVCCILMVLADNSINKLWLVTLVLSFLCNFWVKCSLQELIYKSVDMHHQVTEDKFCISVQITITKIFNCGFCFDRFISMNKIFCLTVFYKEVIRNN